MGSESLTSKPCDGFFEGCCALVDRRARFPEPAAFSEGCDIGGLLCKGS